MTGPNNESNKVAMKVDHVRPKRKHPLGLTLLSENYKQLLQEFEDFQGAGQHDSSEDENQDSICSGACTPVEHPVGHHAPAKQNCPHAPPGLQKAQVEEADKPPRPTLTRRQTCQHTTAGTVVPAVAAAASPASKRPLSSTPNCNSKIKQHAAKQPQQRPKKSAGGVSTPHKPLSPASRCAGSVQAIEASPAAAQETKAPRRAQRQLQQCANNTAQHTAAHGHVVPDGAAGQCQAHKGGKPTCGARLGCSKEQTPMAAHGPDGLPSQQQKTEHINPDQACTAAAPSASRSDIPTQIQVPNQQLQAMSAAAVGALEEVQAAAAAAIQPVQQQQQQQQQQPKCSRRRVGSSSQPLTAGNATKAPAAGAAAGAAAAVSVDVAVAPTPAGAACSRVAVALPRLPLQGLRSPHGQLPHLQPLSARSAQQSAGSGKASKSEPASARMSRRTSDSSTEGSNTLSGGRRSDSMGTSGTARQHSLPEPIAMPSNRRHSIACLVDVSRRQQQQQQWAKGGSEGGAAQLHHADGSAQQRGQQQPLQPLKQLLEIRRRGQLRGGAAADDSSHDCQILVVDSTPTALPPCGNSSSTHQPPAVWQQGPAAVGGPDRAWPSLTDPPAAASVHRRTRSSNTQLPPLEEHAVLTEPGLTHHAMQGLQPAGAAGAAAVDALGVQGLGADGFAVCSVLTSRRSSRADSEASSSTDSTAGGLACEPSSFGVCADPAGAVHLLAPAIPDKLARLKQRLPSRLTSDTAAAAVVGAAGATGGPEAIAAEALQATRQTSDSPAVKAAHPAAGKSGRTRARWQLPAVTPQQQQDAGVEQQQGAPPQQQQQQQQRPQQQAGHPAPQPAAVPLQQQWQQWQQQQQHSQQHQAAAMPAGRSQSCKQMGRAAGTVGPPADTGQQGQHGDQPWGHHSSQQQQPASWDGGSTMHQHPQQSHSEAAASQGLQQQGVSHTFMAEVRRQLEHWASWMHLHTTNPHQIPPPPQLPPQVQAASAYLQQELYLGNFPQQQQQMLQQQQQVHALPAGAAGYQAAVAGPMLAPGALGGFIGPVPDHGALSRFTDPLAEKQQQRLQQQRCGVPGPAADHAGLQYTQQQQQQPQQQYALPLQQQQQVLQAQEPMSPPVVSAAALVQQRRVLQQQAFEGLSFEAVLASAKKTNPPSRRQLVVEEVEGAA